MKKIKINGKEYTLTEDYLTREKILSLVKLKEDYSVLISVSMPLKGVMKEGFTFLEKQKVGFHVDKDLIFPLVDGMVISAVRMY